MWPKDSKCKAAVPALGPMLLSFRHQRLQVLCILKIRLLGFGIYGPRPHSKFGAQP